MAQHHLQLHGQPLGNDEEACGSGSRIGSGSKVRGWLELEQAIAKKNCQGKDFSSQRIQHSKLHSQFMTSLSWIGNESFKLRHNFIPLARSCNFKGRVVRAIPVLPLLLLDISQTSATCNEPLNHFMVSTQ